jgi:hypothetical protein
MNGVTFQIHRPVPYAMVRVYWEYVQNIYATMVHGSKRTFPEAVAQLCYPRKSVVYPENFEYMEDGCPLWTVADI